MVSQIYQNYTKFPMKMKSDEFVKLYKVMRKAFVRNFSFITKNVKPIEVM